MNHRIGGHEGLDVMRIPKGIIKIAHDEVNYAGLQREHMWLQAMLDSGYTPRASELHVKLGDNPHVSLEQEDVGCNEPVTDPEEFRHHITHMLWHMREVGWRHGDATSANIIVRDNHPFLVDGQEAHRIGGLPLRKQPYSDSWLLMRTIGDMEQDPSRIARRWNAILGTLGVNDNVTVLPLKGWPLLDLGCFRGDFAALATVEGMKATAVDRGHSRPEEDSIAVGMRVWQKEKVHFVRQDISDLRFLTDTYAASEHEKGVTTLLLSTWPYVVAERGRAHAEAMLRLIIERSSTLFFECQLHNDGPGPDFLVTESDVGLMLKRLGAVDVDPIVTIPVQGRDAERTIWKVSS